MQEYIGISHALTFMDDRLRQMLQDDSLLLSWAWEAVRKLSFPSLKYYKDFTLLDVENHKAQLPTGLKKISAVYYYGGSATASDLNPYESNCSCEEAEEQSVNCNPLYYRLFIGSDNIKNHFHPVYYAGKVSDNILCKTKSCPDYSFSVNNRLTTLTLSERSGVIALVFHRYIVDEDSKEFALPREPSSLWEYMGAHMSYRAAVLLGENNDRAEYKLQRKAYLDEARGQINLRSFNYKVHKDITYYQSTLMNINQRLMENYNNTNR